MSQFNCPIEIDRTDSCSQLFTSRATFQEHLQLHENEPRCVICGHKYKTDGNVTTFDNFSVLENFFRIPWNFSITGKRNFRPFG